MKTSVSVHRRHTIDAQGRTLGRLATEIAVLLRGKHKVGFSPEKDRGDIVRVVNVQKIRFTGSKIEKKVYYHHSGYPGGLKEELLSKRFQENPQNLLRDVVYHMLPDNTLRRRMIKRLKVE